MRNYWSKVSLPALAAGLLLLLTGCFNYTEEMWLNADGSGRLTGVAIVDTESPLSSGSVKMSPNPEAEMRQNLEGKAGVKLVNLSSTQDNERVTTSWELEFESVEALANLPAGATGQKLYGAISWGKAKGSYGFARDVGVANPSAAANSNPALAMIAQGLMSSMLAQDTLRYTVHFPGEVTYSNGAVLADKKSVSWNIPLSQAVSGNVRLDATVDPGFPWMWIGIGAFLLVDLVVTFLIVRMVLKRRAAQADPAPEAPSAQVAEKLRSADEDFRPRA